MIDCYEQRHWGNHLGLPIFFLNYFFLQQSLWVVKVTLRSVVFVFFCCSLSLKYSKDLQSIRKAGSSHLMSRSKGNI